MKLKFPPDLKCLSILLLFLFSTDVTEARLAEERKIIVLVSIRFGYWWGYGLYVVWSTPFEGEQKCWSGSTYICFCQIFRQILADSPQYFCFLVPYLTTFYICICICETNPSRSTQYSGCLALYPATLVAHQSHCQRATPTKAPLNTCCLGFHQNTKKIQVKYQVPKDKSKIPPIRVIGSTVSTASRMISHYSYAWYLWGLLQIFTCKKTRTGNKIASS